MSTSVLIGAANQVVAYEIRSVVGEVEDTTVVDVADSSQRLEDLVIRHDPDIVLVHDQLGPNPLLHTIRDITTRRPASAIVLLVEEPTSEVLTQAMDAGARGVLAYPVSLGELQARIVSAGQWSAQMRRHLSHSLADDGADSSRARMIVVAGAKGGVGTSTIACHLAYHAIKSGPGRSVCLVDLDLDKPDLGNFLGISHRLDISDLAKVADDLGQQTVASAVHRGSDGLATLLGPAHIEDVEVVDERETRLILAALRRQFDLVIVDAGARVNPCSAAAVEAADDVALITTPEVLALRGVHRTAETWERVGARKLDAVHIVLNRASKVPDIQPDSAAKLLPVPPVEVRLPAAFKKLEPGLNYRSPAEVKDREWWTRIGDLVDLLGIGAVASTGESRDGRGRRRNTKRGVSRGAKAESGAVTLEFAGVLPAILMIMVVLWQLSLWAATAALSGHAMDEAARAAALGQPVEPAALDAVPDWFASEMDVWESDGEVHLRAGVPLLAPGLTTESFTYTTSIGVTYEP